MLDGVRRGEWGLSGRLIASYILVTLAVVVLVEALVVGFQVPQLLYSAQVQAQLQAQVDATATSYGRELAQRYPGGGPTGTLLGVPGQPARPGQARSGPQGTLIVPAIKGPVDSDQAVTAVLAIAADGTVVASSAPSQYPPGRAAASELPAPVTFSIADGRIDKTGWLPTPHGSVLWTLAWPAAGAGRTKLSASGTGLLVYVQAPWSVPLFINPVRARGELDQLGETGPLLLWAPPCCCSWWCRSACCSGC
jgi:hypothetical protein